MNLPANRIHELHDKKNLNKLRNPILSIVIPIYNVEDYLAATIESLVNQKQFNSYEVILVNDGSTDGSTKIARDFASQYPNIWFYEQLNSGAGKARNYGLQQVTTELVTFLDSDDILPQDAYTGMLRQFSHPEVDVVIGRMERIPNPQKFIWNTAFEPGTRIEPGIVTVPELIHGAGPCNKVFRVSSMRKNGFQFGEGVHFEDAHFVVPFLLKSNAIGIQNRVTYNYRKRDNDTSVMDSLFTREKNFWDYLDLCDSLIEQCRDIDDAKKSILDDFIIRGMQGFVYRAFQMFDDAKLFRFQIRLQKIFKSISISSIKKSTAHPGIRLAYARLLSYDPHDFERSMLENETLSIVGTKPYIGYDRSPEPELRMLRQTGNILFGIESFTRQGKSIVLEGRVTTKHGKISTIPGAKLQLRIAGMRFEGEWQSRTDRRHSAGYCSGFRFSVPNESWPSGRHLIHIFLVDTTGTFGATTHKTMAMFRNSLPFAYSGMKYQVSADERNRVLVEKKTNHLKSSWHRLLEDIQNVRTGQPFAKEILVRAVTKKFVRKPIWIVGERWGAAQDNGSAFFDYAHKSDVNANVFYLSGEKGAQSQRTLSGNKVVPTSSLRHKFLMLHASVILNAYDVDTYTLPKSWDKMDYLQYLRPRTRTKRVFLQHGVIYRDTASGLHRLVQGYDYFVTTTNDETSYVSKELSYGSNRAVRSGLPRFSKLTNKKTDSTRRILFAPTWRKYVVTPSYLTNGSSGIDENFYDSDYFVNINGFLQSDKLLQFLEQNNCVVDFIPHPEVKSAFETISFNERIIFNKEVDYAQSLRACSIFITDYSSVLFDAAFLRKPSIYFTFDEIEFESLHSRKGYFDFARDGFGESVDNVEDLIDGIERIAKSDYIVPQPYLNRMNSQFNAISVDPSELIIDKIISPVKKVYNHAK
ncbi:CDP-glycerol glycerophosphotransferase (TagB/SpsB family) [Arthrobacter sp. AG1021]|uniref:bifunctional glycosyltransferase/CDP-glycerol:glycerophosphate glycerophosphotransferase n=1 Tax=Arthrobacter sp. AG1021 TaxID=2183908 RepID=UPI000EB301FA|nr:glycosyltransferase [Arthrobacter sp. AG1021]RKS19543.1 CDP-glycerol glycerophosphotransferase (TagB/SpsB family) [Arthrobacter sp. AG1021]